MGRPDPELRGAIIAYLRKHHPDTCRHWFDDIQPVDLAQGVVRLLVREPVQLRYLQRCCAQPFTEAVQAVTGGLLADSFEREDDLIATAVAPSGSDQPAENAEALPAMAEDMILSPDYSFDNFVIGPANRLAHAASVAVAQKPGRAYNPLFVHGGVGLGKTHLLQAICLSILSDAPRTKIHYISCNTFMEQFHECVRAGRMSDFRHRFRTVDVLVLDDIHFLSRHEQTQEEFFHTFNSLQQSGKQVVLSSDAPPSEIPDLEERLVSRFNCGLVARIDKPCYETRLAIVRTKAAIRDLQIPDDVAAYVAARIDSNIREIEGAITRIQALALASGLAIDLNLAKQALADDSGGGRGGNQLTIQSIIDAVTRYYDVKLVDLLSKRRHKSIALPRQVCMYLARKHTRYSLEEIGGYFGGRDHTTVMHAVKTVTNRCGNDESFSGEITRLEERLAGPGS